MGQGEMIDLKKRCKTCKGKKVCQNKKKLFVEIDKGTPNGEQYTISGEGDCVPDVDPGDVIVKVSVKNDKMFTRKGADLYMAKEISLFDSLTGVDFTITHLDERIVRIQNKPGEIIKPDSTMTCPDLGMPFHKTPYKNGNLYIKFTIKFPDKIDPKQFDSINEILSSQKKSAKE